MKSTAVHSFRRKLQANEPVYGIWVTLEAAAVSDIAAGLGFDWIVIDAAHGHLDWAEVLEHIRATARSETVAMVRLADATPELIQRALGLGADGVLISGVKTANQLSSIIEASRGLQDSHATGTSDARFLIVPVIGIEAPNLGEMISVDGAEVFFFERQGSGIGSSARAEQDRMHAEIRKRGKHAGIVAESDEALSGYRERLFSVLGVGPDSEIIRRGIQSTLDAVAVNH